MSVQICLFQYEFILHFGNGARCCDPQLRQAYQAPIDWIVVGTTPRVRKSNRQVYKLECLIMKG